MNRLGWGLLLWSGLHPSLGEQLGVQRIAHRPVDVLDISLSDVGNDVVGRVVPPVLDHGRLDRVLDASQPLIQRGDYLAVGSSNDVASLVVGDCGPALFPRLLFGSESASSLLATLSGQWIRRDVEPVGPRLPALGYMALHAALPSVSMNSRSLADTTYTRRPRRLVGRSPALAKR